MALDPHALTLVGHDRRRRHQLLRGGMGRVRLEDTRLRLDDLAERPEGHTLAIRERAALPPRNQLVVAVDDPAELVQEPALADPGYADQRDELCRAFLACAGKRVDEHVELGLTPDKLRAAGPAQVDPEA